MSDTATPQAAEMIERLMSDESFRREFERNPRDVAARFGLSASEDDSEVRALAAFDWDSVQNPEELADRVSKSGGLMCGGPVCSDVNLKRNIVPVEW